MKKLFIFLFIFPLFVLASQPLPFNLTYPNVTTSSKIKEQNYDRVTIYIKGEGNRHFYGHLWEQKFKYPKFENNTHKKALKEFIRKSLNLKTSDITSADYVHFSADGKEYWLKFSLYHSSYSYKLLRVEDYVKRISFDESIAYKLDKKFIRRHGKVEIPKNIAIAHIKDYAIERYTYHKYDEQTLRYDKKSIVHKGKFWKIDFTTLKKDKNSHRYALAHDYTAKILKLGATILKDEDNGMLFRLPYKNAINYIKINSYNSKFSLSILQEEAFKQSLILTPDAIKEELDKTGKITLDGIFFEFNKATLKAESQKAILTTVALMQRYEDLILTVNG